MKQELSYYRVVLRRHNLVKEAFLDGFQFVASYPRLLLETFIRKNFGERYYKMSSVITVAAVLGICPLLSDSLMRLFVNNGYADENSGFWLHYATWYLFLAAFLWRGYLHWREVKKNAALYDFSQYTLYDGDIHPFFFEQKIIKGKNTIRKIETLLEPALFFVIGLPLWLLGQKVGALLTVCSLFYSLGYLGAYRRGDDYMKDMSDRGIVHRDLSDFLRNKVNAAQARQAGIRGEIPRGAEPRQRLLNTIEGLQGDDPRIAI